MSWPSRRNLHKGPDPCAGRRRQVVADAIGRSTYRTGPEDRGERLDRFLTRRSDGALSRTRVKALIETGEAAIDGKPVTDASLLLQPDQEVSLTIPPSQPAAPAA